MTSGGARSRSGPPADAEALRRDREAGDWIALDAAPVTEPPPTWPLSKPFRAREKTLWAREWARPQAVMWRRLGLEEEVAAYVRTVVRFEGPESRTGDGTLMRQLAEDLGISMSGLARNRWTIGKPASVAAAKETTEPTGPTAKERLKLVAGGGGR
jgi:hypothetical protein